MSYKFNPAQYRHALWMLNNQINSAYELIALWVLFPAPDTDVPAPECTTPWHRGLEVAIEKSAN